MDEKPHTGGLPEDNEFSEGVPVLPPLSGLIELAVLIACIVGFGWIFPEVDISEIQPNPFWLPVLLLSLQYGTISGLLAAGMALLVTVASGLPAEGVGENHFSYAMRVFSQPILWFASAVLLGQFRMRQIVAKQALRKDVLELSKQRAALAEYATDLRARLEMLERDRAGESDVPSIRLLQRFDDLRRADTDLALSFASAMDCAFPGAAVSLFCVTSQGLAKMADNGWPDGNNWAQLFAPSHPLYVSVITEGGSLTALRRGDDLKLDREGLFAVPILPRDSTGPVVGLVKIERIDGSAMTPETLSALRLVAMLLSQRLGPGAQRSAGAFVQSHEEAPNERLVRRNIRWHPKSGSHGEATRPTAEKPSSKSAAVS